MSYKCPEGIDPSVWESMPSDIQTEIINQRTSTARTHQNEQFDQLSNDNSKRNAKRKAEDQTSQSMITNWTKSSKPQSSIFTKKDVVKTDVIPVLETPNRLSPAMKEVFVQVRQQQASVFASENKCKSSNVIFTDIDFPASAESIDGRQVPKNVPVVPNASTHGIPIMNPSMPPVQDNKINEVLFCKCRVPVKIRQVNKDGANQGRYFASCLLRTCSHFAWADNSPHTESVSKLEWKRFHRSDGWSLFGSRGIYGASPQDILQGGVGDCWFLSALAVIAERTDLIQNVIKSTELNDDGKLLFSLFIDGIWQDVIVDNYLPCQPPSKIKKVNPINNSLIIDREGSTLAYSKAAHKQLWVPFLEKAYAKAHGSYHAVSGGHIHEALLDLTGAPCHVIDFSDPAFDSEETWILLMSYCEARFPIGCATSATGEGIVGNHAYSVLDVKEISDVLLGEQKSIQNFFDDKSPPSVSANTDYSPSKSSYSPSKSSIKNFKDPIASDLMTDQGSIRLLRIRNPWGKKEWQGVFAEKSEVWTKKLRKLLDKGDKNDGTFWISYHDFLRRFCCVDVCKVHYRGGWVGVSLEGSTRGQTLGPMLGSLGGAGVGSILGSVRGVAGGVAVGMPSGGGGGGSSGTSSGGSGGGSSSVYSNTFYKNLIDNEIPNNNSKVPETKRNIQNAQNTLYMTNISNILDISTDTYFEITITEPTWLYLTLIQKSKRGKNQSNHDRSYWYASLALIVLEVSKDNGESVLGNVLGGSFCGAVRDSSPVELQLAPGTYAVVPLHFAPGTNIRLIGMEKKRIAQPFVLRIYSSHPVLPEEKQSAPSASASSSSSAPSSPFSFSPSYISSSSSAFASSSPSSSSSTSSSAVPAPSANLLPDSFYTSHFSFASSSSSFSSSSSSSSSSSFASSRPFLPPVCKGTKTKMNIASQALIAIINRAVSDANHNFLGLKRKTLFTCHLRNMEQKNFAPYNFNKPHTRGKKENPTIVIKSGNHPDVIDISGDDPPPIILPPIIADKADCIDLTASNGDDDVRQNINSDDGRLTSNGNVGLQNLEKYSRIDLPGYSLIAPASVISGYSMNFWYLFPSFPSTYPAPSYPDYSPPPEIFATEIIDIFSFKTDGNIVILCASNRSYMDINTSIHLETSDFQITSPFATKKSAPNNMHIYVEPTPSNSPIKDNRNAYIKKKKSDEYEIKFYLPSKSHRIIGILISSPLGQILDILALKIHLRGGEVDGSPDISFRSICCAECFGSENEREDRNNNDNNDYGMKNDSHPFNHSSNGINNHSVSSNNNYSFDDSHFCINKVT